MDPAGARLPRQVLMIVHAYYDEDPRVRREAEALAASGRPVTVIGLRRDGDPPSGMLAGVSIVRIDVRRHQGAGLGTYLREYLAFGVRAAWTAIGVHRVERVGLVQVHSLPDFLVFAAAPLRLVGVPVLLDLHEAMPEFFRSRFKRASNPFVDRLVRLQERLSIAFATHTLSVNAAMRERLLRLGVRPDRVSEVPNAPSLARFDPAVQRHRAFREDGALRLVYAGALTPTYELDVALRAVRLLRSTRPDLDVRLDLYGRGDSEPALRALAEEHGLDDAVTFHGRIRIEAVPAALAEADIGLAPTRLDGFTALTMSTKIHEYAAMGRPVVASRLPMITRTFPPGTVAVYESGDVAGMAAAIVAFADDPDRRSSAATQTARIVAETAWERHAPAYLAIVERLARDGRPALAQATPSRW